MVNIKNTKNKVYFIDYENVHRFDPSKKEGETIKVVLFVGNTQNHIPIDIIMKLHTITTHIEIVKMAHIGKNCLDFHLCYKMGEMNKTVPSLVEFIVLSKDKGFDSIVKYIQSLGRLCSRKEKFA